MRADLPNFVPEHGTGLLDALTLDYGPRDLIVPIMVRGNLAARAQGIRLRIRHDFDVLASLNAAELAKGQKGNWFKLVNMLNPEFGGLAPENAYWISGENEQNEVVVTAGGRIYHWPHTTLADEALSMFYGGRIEGRRCEVTAPVARKITGVVCCGGAMWVRPDYRGKQFARLIPRISRAYVASRWPVDFHFSLMQPDVHPRVIAAYGYEVERAICFPGSPWGDLTLAVASMTRQKIYADLADFLASDLSEPGAAYDAGAAPTSKYRDESVSSTSPEPVLQGRMSRS